MSEREEIAWAAGLFEGEGCIDCTRRKYRDKVYVTPRLQLSMTDEEVVRKFHETLGCGRVNGPYRSRLSTRPYWRWAAHGKETRVVLDVFLPFLSGRRRAKAEEVLAE
jgi:hypothetical protein